MQRRHVSGFRLLALAFSTLGVVYGDIGEGPCGLRIRCRLRCWPQRACLTAPQPGSSWRTARAMPCCAAPCAGTVPDPGPLTQVRCRLTQERGLRAPAGVYAAGTSPLYVYGAVFPDGAPDDEKRILGVASTIFWTITMIGGCSAAGGGGKGARARAQGL